VDLVDGKDGREMVDTGVYTNLVHDGDTSLLGLCVELHHRWGDVGGCDDVLLLADRRLDDGRVECVGDEGDYDVDLGDFSVESVGIVDIEADGVGVGDTLGQVLSLLESTACYCDLDTGLCEDVNSGSCDETSTKQQSGLSAVCSSSSPADVAHKVLNFVCDGLHVV